MANRHVTKIRSIPKMDMLKEDLKIIDRYSSPLSYIHHKCLMEIFELEQEQALLEIELQLNKLNTDGKIGFIKQNFNSWWRYYFTDEMDVSEDTRLN